MKKMNEFETIDTSFSEERLNSVSLKTSSKGVLHKWIATINNTRYYIKTGNLRYREFSNTEPVMECIAYEVGNLLGFRCAEYSLSKIHLKESDIWDEQNILVCMSKDFLSKGETFMSMYNVIRHSIDISTSDLYSTIINKYPNLELDLNSMIVFDYIFNNPDRHLKNFGLIYEDGNMKEFSPLFDNGLSLFCGEILDVPLTKLSRMDNCKPFKSRHSQAMKLVKALPKLNLSISDTEIENVFKKYRSYLGEKRYKIMVELFFRRLCDARRLYSILHE